MINISINEHALTGDWQHDLAQVLDDLAAYVQDLPCGHLHCLDRLKLVSPHDTTKLYGLVIITPNLDDRVPMKRAHKVGSAETPRNTAQLSLAPVHTP